MGDLRITGWAQGLYEQSATKKHLLGTLRITDDGRKFRYAKAGEDLVAGNFGHMSQATANHVKQTGDVIAVNSIQVSLVLGATAATLDQYADGFLQVYDGAAGTVGYQYGIASNKAADSAGTIILQLKDPIKVALISTDTWSLVPNPWNGVTEDAAVAHGAAGIAPIAVTSGYYYWCQTGGPALVLNKSNTALGSVIAGSSTTGAVYTAADYTGPFAGFTYSFASVDGKYNPVFLTID